MRFTTRAKCLFCFLILNMLCFNLAPGQNISVIHNSEDTLTKSSSGKYDNGYSENDEKNLSGSTVVLNSGELNKGLIISWQDLLTGKVPGLLISSYSGAPGSNFMILNRGENTFYGSGAPLIIVDDVIIYENPLNLNPDDIESITVLKDAVSASRYGEGAYNGAIVINTKKGTKELVVDYSGKSGFSVLQKKIDLFSAGEFRSLINEKYSSDPDVISLLGNSNTDWQGEIFRTAFGQDHHLSISGSAAGIPVRVSFGRTDQNGILKTSKYGSTTSSVSINPALFKNHLKIGLNLKGIFNDNRIADERAIRNAAIFDPTQPVLNNSPYGGYFTWTNPDNSPNSFAIYNPVALLALQDCNQSIERIIGNITLDYKLHFLPDLRIVFNYGIDNLNLKNLITIDTSASWTYDSGRGYGFYEKINQTSKNNQWNLYVDYSKYFDRISSRLEFVAGYYSLHQALHEDDHASTFFDKDHTFEISNSSMNYDEDWGFGRISFLFHEKYNLNLILRQDGNSNFTDKYRFAYSPCLSFSWNLKNESLLSKINTISDLSLRVGYGMSGAFQPASSQYNLYHEKRSSFDLGIDYSLYNRKITGYINFYSTIGNNLINLIPVPSGSNLSGYVLVNDGKVQNKGIEFSINGNIISAADLLWEIDLNGSYNRNKNISAGIPGFQGVSIGPIPYAYQSYIQIRTTGYPEGSFFVYQQVYDQSGKPQEGVYVDRSGDGIINASDKYRFKKSQPDASFGLSSRLKFGDWDFYLSGRLSLGNYVYNSIASFSFYENLDWYGSLRNVPKTVKRTDFINPQIFSDYYIQNASFFRMEYMTLGYSFNNLWNDKLKIHLSAFAQNLFVLTGYKGQDPEVPTGIDGYSYPRSRTFSLGLNIDF